MNEENYIMWSFIISIGMGIQEHFVRLRWAEHVAFMRDRTHKILLVKPDGIYARGKQKIRKENNVSRDEKKSIMKATERQFSRIV